MSRTKSPQRRERLLAAGEQVLLARGAARATVAEVTETAGVAKGTFYLYFHSKNDLLLALRRRFVGQLAAAASTELDAGRSRDWFEVAQDLLESVTDIHLENAALYAALFEESAAEGHEEERWSDEIVGLVGRFIEAGNEAGAFAVRDAEATATLIFHAIHGLLHETLRRPEVLDRSRLLSAAGELLSRTLAGGGVVADRRQPGVGR
jgi:AcrR family transcriptional regulator